MRCPFNKGIVALAILLTPLAIAQDSEKVFSAGASLSNITPWFGTSLAGSMTDRTATSISDELYVRSIVMDDGATILSISLVDACMVERPIIDAAKERASNATGIPVGNMLVAATHSHAAGTCAHVFQSDPDPTYTTFVSRRIADGITRAWQQRVPAKIGWGAGSVPDEVFNRRWHMKDGTVGDINNINFAIPAIAQKPGEQMNLVGNKVAAEVHRAYGAIEFQNWVPLAAVQKEIALGIRKPTAEEVVEAKAILATAQQENRALNSLREYYANCTVDLADYPDTDGLILQALQIGDLGIAAIPCETFVEIGLAIKAQSPFGKSFTIELANGYNGYLPTEAQHALGGYETWRAKSSRLEVGAAKVIQQSVLELLAELKANADAS